MEFTLICPTDGRIELGLEDISAVVFHGSDSVHVVFECPHCHSSIRADVHVPDVLGAALELHQFAEDDQAFRDVSGNTMNDDPLDHVRLREQREHDGEAYCEYFRRQLSRVETAEDLLAEFDQG